MKWTKRLANLWRLSSYEPGSPTDETKTPGTIVSMLVKKPEQKTIFIPRITRSAADEIINEPPQ